MKPLKKKIQKIFLLCVPITLVLSIYLNSIAILLTLLVFLPDLKFKGLGKHRKKNILLFFVLLGFVFTYLIGFFIDLNFGILNIKKMERLLPFVIFPLIYLYSPAIQLFKHQAFPLKVFAGFMSALSLALLLVFAINFYLDFKDTSLMNKRWAKKNAHIQAVTTQLSKGSFKPYKVDLKKGSTAEISYERFFSIDKDTFMTRSIYTKTSNVWLLIRQFDGVNHQGAWFNLENGTVGFIQKNVRAAIETLGNGWFRCSVTNKVQESTSRERLQITFVDGDKKYSGKFDTNKSVLLGGPQLEFGINTTAYRPLKHRDFWEGFDRNKILAPIKNHPTYYSIFLVFSSLMILILFNNWKIQVPLLIINISMLALLASKAGIISLCFLLVIYCLLFFKKFSKQNWAIVGLSLIGAAALFLSTSVTDRFDQAIGAFDSQQANEQLSTEIRMSLWRQIKDIPMEDLLIGRGMVNGYKGLNQDFNTHNQYLEVILSSGIAGLTFLIIFLLGPFVISVDLRRNRIAILFIALIIFNLFFENLFNRQWGIVFVSYFLAFFCATDKDFET